MPLSLHSLQPAPSCHVTSAGLSLSLPSPHSGPVTSPGMSLSFCTILTQAPSRHVTSYITHSLHHVMSSGMPLSLHSPHSDPLPSCHQVCRSLCTVLTQTPSRHSLSAHSSLGASYITRYASLSAQSPVRSRHVTKYAFLSAQSSFRSRQQVCHCLHSSRSIHVTQAQSITSYSGLCAQSSLRPCHITSPSMPVCLQCPHSGPVTSRHQVFLSVCIVLTQATSRDVTTSLSVCIVLTQVPSRNVICKSVCTVLIHSRRIDHTLEQR